MSRKSKGSGLFNGHWDRVHDDEGARKHVRIQRSEYPELYRLHRLCSQIERAGVRGPARHHTGESRPAFSPGLAKLEETHLWREQIEANPFR